MPDSERTTALLLRLVWGLCALALVVVIATAVAARENQDTRAVGHSGPAAAAAAPVADVRGHMPAERIVRARVGDVVSVTVTTPEPDRAGIPELGVDATTSESVPGVLEIVAEQPGRYPVVLQSTEKPIGTVVIAGSTR